MLRLSIRGFFGGMLILLTFGIEGSGRGEEATTDLRILAAVVNDVGADTFGAVIQKESLPAEYLATIVKRPSRWQRRGLRRLLDQLVRKSKVELELPDLDIPASECVSKASLDEIFSPRGGRWSEFREKYSGRPLIKLSQPATSKDARKAVVFRIVTEGLTGGTGELLILESDGHRWSISRRIELFVA